MGWGRGWCGSGAVVCLFLILVEIGALVEATREERGVCTHVPPRPLSRQGKRVGPSGPSQPHQASRVETWARDVLSAMGVPVDEDMQTFLRSELVVLLVEMASHSSWHEAQEKQHRVKRTRAEWMERDPPVVFLQQCDDKDDASPVPSGVHDVEPDHTDIQDEDVLKKRKREAEACAAIRPEPCEEPTHVQPTPKPQETQEPSTRVCTKKKKEIVLPAKVSPEEVVEEPEEPTTKEKGQPTPGPEPGEPFEMDEEQTQEEPEEAKRTPSGAGAEEPEEPEFAPKMPGAPEEGEEEEEEPGEIPPYTPPRQFPPPGKKRVKKPTPTQAVKFSASSLEGLEEYFKGPYTCWPITNYLANWRLSAGIDEWEDQLEYIVFAPYLVEHLTPRLTDRITPELHHHTHQELIQTVHYGILNNVPGAVTHTLTHYLGFEVFNTVTSTVTMTLTPPVARKLRQVLISFATNFYFKYHYREYMKCYYYFFQCHYILEGIKCSIPKYCDNFNMEEWLKSFVRRPGRKGERFEGEGNRWATDPARKKDGTPLTEERDYFMYGETL